LTSSAPFSVGVVRVKLDHPCTYPLRDRSHPLALSQAARRLGPANFLLREDSKLINPGISHASPVSISEFLGRKVGGSAK
jgi:hypothetical protein